MLQLALPVEDPVGVLVPEADDVRLPEGVLERLLLKVRLGEELMVVLWVRLMLSVRVAPKPGDAVTVEVSVLVAENDAEKVPDTVGEPLVVQLWLQLLDLVALGLKEHEAELEGVAELDPEILRLLEPVGLPERVIEGLERDWLKEAVLDMVCDALAVMEFVQLTLFDMLLVPEPE